MRSAPRWSAAGKGWSCSRLGRVAGVTISTSRRQAISSSGAARTISCSPRHEAEHRPRPPAAAPVPQVGVPSTVQAVAQMRPSVVRQTESSVGSGSSWAARMCRYRRSQRPVWPCSGWVGALRALFAAPSKYRAENGAISLKSGLGLARFDVHDTVGKITFRRLPTILTGPLLGASKTKSMVDAAPGRVTPGTGL